MRYQPEHKPRTRGRIVDEARRSFLSHGQDGIGVDGIMKGAGLTAGGFYAHFESKNALFNEALDKAFEASMAIFFRDLETRNGPEAIEMLTRRYLSRDHRDHVAQGCPIPPLAVDVARGGRKTQAVFAARIRELMATMAPWLESRRDFDASDRALALLALYAGGLTLARATSGSPLSDQFLVACRKLARLAQGAPGGRSRTVKSAPTPSTRGHP